MSGALTQLRDTVQRFRAGLSARDRRALTALTCFLILLCAWALLWQPVQAAHERNEKAYLAARLENDWMHAHAPELKPPAPGTADENVSLLTFATNAAQLYRITISHAEPASDGSLHLSIENAAFTDIVTLLDALRREHGIYAREITLDRRQDKDGYVDVSLLLGRTASY